MASTSIQQAISSMANPDPQPQVSRHRRLEDLALVLLVGFAPLLVSAFISLSRFSSIPAMPITGSEVQRPSAGASVVLMFI
jgi:hypothetical protein